MFRFRDKNGERFFTLFTRYNEAKVFLVSLSCWPLSDVPVEEQQRVGMLIFFPDRRWFLGLFGFRLLGTADHSECIDHNGSNSTAYAAIFVKPGKNVFPSNHSIGSVTLDRESSGDRNARHAPQPVLVHVFKCIIKQRCITDKCNDPWASVALPFADSAGE